uniref:Uncharacterized protein n=1 Tax=Timema monikensis TaxID=170555 RepID=A0A7R9EJU7_9NEOP|nr:unnamed protein product [Timema monikensis]
MRLEESLGHVVGHGVTRLWTGINISSSSSSAPSSEVELYKRQSGQSRDELNFSRTAHADESEIL